MKKVYSIALAAVAALLAACAGSENDPVPAPAPVICPEDFQAVPLKEVARDNVPKANGFAIDLFRRSFAASGTDNTCISPVSVFAALAMAANGDSGPTRDNVLDVLGYDAGDLSMLNIFCNALLTETKALNGTSDCVYSQSVWHKPDVTLNSTFERRMRGVFDADIFSCNLASGEGMAAINQYVSDFTRGMIPEFLSQPLDVRVALINTTYFKGKWKEPFDPGQTSEGTFTNLDGSYGRVDFMFHQGTMQYGLTDGIECLRLPYLGDRFTMTLLLPESPSGFADMLADLSPARLAALDAGISTTEGMFVMPRFEASTSVELLDILRDMGLGKDNPAMFDSVSDDEVFVLSTVKHGVRIIVDEEGTEGAATTIVGMDNAIGTFVSFNRPFIYMVRDTEADAVLFIGAVTKF